MYACNYLISFFPNVLLSFGHVFVHVRFISIVTGDFRNYDYGIAENYKRYKQKTPPSYDVKKITAPMILFYSENDYVTTEEVTVFHLASHCLIFIHK